jgi:hypothetical protein
MIDRHVHLDGREYVVVGVDEDGAWVVRPVEHGEVVALTSGMLRAAGVDDVTEPETDTEWATPAAALASS